MPKGLPVPHWKRVSDKDTNDWISLPVRVLASDVTTILLTPQEVDAITKYGDAYFDKQFIDSRPSQWASSKGFFKRNPNTTGIKGEYGGVKHFASQIALDDFLRDRPWKMSDMGDAILIGREAKIFDYKTRTRKASIAELVSSDLFCAEMDAKFADRKKYSYLQGFIFCVNNEAMNQIHLMGWMTAQEFFKNAQRLPKGSPIPFSSLPYSSDTLIVPYRRLNPISELAKCSYQPITQSTTLQFKEDWKKGKLDVQQYLTNMREMPSAYARAN